MKVNTSPRVGLQNPDLQREMRDHALAINAIAEGRMAAFYNAQTSAPTTGTYAQGDFIRNSTPSETGSPAYVVYGWLCVSGGAPGTWVDCRFLTGN